MFYGDRFIFDGTPCEEYGLMLYNVGSSSQEQTSFSSDSELVEDRIPRRYDPLFYGVERNTPLSFPLTFGMNPDKVNNGDYFDRWDFERIASWLTGLDGYRWLEILAPGLDNVRYLCTIQNLKVVQAGQYPQVFTCKVVCDSPFAYMNEREFEIDEAGSFSIHNRSTYNGLYYPVIEFEVSSADDISLKNLTTNQEIKFSQLPTTVAGGTITIDMKNQVITSSDGLNLYPYCNKQFVGLVRGNNDFVLSGDCSMKMICQFPVNVGC